MQLHSLLRLALIKAMWIPRSSSMEITTEEIKLQVLLHNPLKKLLVPLGLSVPLSEFSEEAIEQGQVAGMATEAFCTTILNLATDPTSSLNQFKPERRPTLIAPPPIPFGWGRFNIPTYQQPTARGTDAQCEPHVYPLCQSGEYIPPRKRKHAITVWETQSRGILHESVNIVRTSFRVTTTHRGGRNSGR